MERTKKEYLPEVDYASFMLAIVLARHAVDADNVDQQWSADDLSVNMNKLRWGNTANFGVDYVALKHGMQLFSAGLRRRSVMRITMFHGDKSIPPFFSLDGHRRSVEIKFSSYYTPPAQGDVELLIAIRDIRDDLLKRSNYPSSIHCSASAVLGSLHFKPYRNPYDVEVAIKIKSPDEISQRSISRNRDKLISDSDELFGKKHSVFYLESALKKARKRQKKEEEDNPIVIDKEKNNIENQDFDDVDNLADDEICDDMRVVNSLALLPIKNVLFETDDQTNILKIYSVVKSVVEERSYRNPAVVAADITEVLLSNNNYYSTISSRTITRWCAVLDKKKKKKEGKLILILKLTYGVT